MCHILFIYSSINGHLGCFHILATVNNASMSVGGQIHFHVPVFIYFGYIPRRGVFKSYSNSMFNFLRNHHTIFHSCCTILHSQQQWARIPTFAHSHQYVLFYFANSHPNACEMESPHGFDVHFPNG